ncbi:MAG: hypothetical protein HY721_13400 [Planctomycetes bacterium]|nr:hypothetical protein [Planctomycetota bacterium]
MLDLLLGVGLIAVIPFLAYVLNRILEPRRAVDITVLGGRPKVDPAPDDEEVEGRMRVAEALLTVNARGYLKQAEEQRDSQLRDCFRRWAGKALRTAHAEYEGLEKLITSEKYPEARNKFGEQLARIAGRKKEIEADLERVKAMDPLKRGEE